MFQILIVVIAVRIQRCSEKIFDSNHIYIIRKEESAYTYIFELFLSHFDLLFINFDLLYINFGLLFINFCLFLPLVLA